MSGSTGERVAVVTASARSLPALTYSIDDDMVANITCTCPPRVASNARDRRDVEDEIEIELVVEGGVDRVHSNASEKRIAVGGCTYNGLSANIAAATRSVLNDEWLAQALRQPLTHQACEDVGWAASGKGDDHAHRPRRISLRPSEARDGRERGSARCQMQKISAGKFHFEPPSLFTSLDRLVGAGEQCGQFRRR